MSKLLILETSREGQRKLVALDDDAGEVEEMNLQRVHHALPCDNDLLGLLLHRERPV